MMKIMNGHNVFASHEVNNSKLNGIAGIVGALCSFLIASTGAAQSDSPSIVNSRTQESFAPELQVEKWSDGVGRQLSDYRDKVVVLHQLCEYRLEVKLYFFNWSYICGNI